MESFYVLVALLFVGMVIYDNGITAEAQFKVTAGGWQKWEAESAQRHGNWKVVEHEWASGGKYVESASDDKSNILSFPFEVSKRTRLQVFPLWWRNGEQKPARRFGEPFLRAFGPVSVCVSGERAYFVAPARGLIGIADVRKAELVNTIEVDGYPADCALDGENHRLYVADAARHRVLAVDTVSERIIQEIPVPSTPWSITFHSGRLFVACLQAKCVAVVDTRQTGSAGRGVRSVPVPAPPYHVSVVQNPSRLAVWLLPLIIHPETYAEQPPDRINYFAYSHREAGIPPPFPGETADAYGSAKKIFCCGKPHRFNRLWDNKELDVSAVTASPTGEPRTPLNPGPDAVGQLNSIAFFTSPSTGRVGVLNMETEKIEAIIETGGYPSDLVVDPFHDQVFVADAAQDRVVVIDAQRRKVIQQIPVPQHPCSLALVGGKLVVACDERRTLVVVDTTTKELVHKIELPASPYEVRSCRLYPPFTFLCPEQSFVYNYLPADEVAPERILVRFRQPLAFAPDTLTSVPAHDLPARPPQAEGDWKRPSSDSLTLSLNEQQVVDVSEACDPQRDVEPALLRAGDLPGTISLALDEGSWHDWTRNIWLTPDTELFLDRHSPEFLEYNAPVFTAEPGKHIVQLRANNRFARLDALLVRATLEGSIAVNLLPEPRAIHAAVRVAAYQPVFYADEPPLFTLHIRNLENRPQRLTMKATIHHLTDDEEELITSGLRLPAAGETKDLLRPHLKRWGVFKLRLQFSSRDGQMMKTLYFLRLPKLGHPRLLFRHDEQEVIRSRIQRYALLFRRYADYLRRHCDEPDFLPATLLSRFPSDEYRNVLPKWRALCVQFAAMFLEREGDSFFHSRAARLIRWERPDQHTFVHNWFRGAQVYLNDMAAGDNPSLQPRVKEAYGTIRDLNYLEETLIGLDEPLTPQMRCQLSELVKWLVNVDTYLEAHAGKSGGNLYHGCQSWCVCPLFGTLGGYVMLANVFGMKSLLSQPYLSGWFTHYRYVYPRYHRPGEFAPGTVASGGPQSGRDFLSAKTMLSAVAALTRNPLEKKLLGWSEWIGKLNTRADLGEEEVDRIFHHDVNALVPLFLALGWFEPDAPEMSYDELPPSQLFDGEGEVVMQSGWDQNATSVYFACGVRDLVYRQHAGTLRIMKAGETLVSEPWIMRSGDHAQPVPSWGNTVVVGDEWQQWWRRGVGHRRGEEFMRLNRHTPLSRVYALRTLALTGGVNIPGAVMLATQAKHMIYQLGFHEHVQNPFMEEGKIVAFEGTPSYDYVAGEMTNAWPVESVRELWRQVVFVKPGWVIVFDRGVLNNPDEIVRWIAATGTKPQIGEHVCRVEKGKARLSAYLLLPEGGEFQPNDISNYAQPFSMPMVEILHPRPAQEVEFLVAMQITAEDEHQFTPSLRRTANEVIVTLMEHGRKTEVRFRRHGALKCTVVSSP